MVHSKVTRNYQITDSADGLDESEMVVRFPLAASYFFLLQTKLNSVALVRERTIPTERPPPVGEVSANFCE
jgi:hypothetical protein